VLIVKEIKLRENIAARFYSDQAIREALSMLAHTSTVFTLLKEIRAIDLRQNQRYELEIKIFVITP
jgi:hypothetical protein